RRGPGPGRGPGRGRTGRTPAWGCRRVHTGWRARAVWGRARGAAPAARRRGGRALVGGLEKGDAARRRRGVRGDLPDGRSPGLVRELLVGADPGNRVAAGGPLGRGERD